MIALIQRVTRAQVHIDGASVGEIGTGVLALPHFEALRRRFLTRRRFRTSEARVSTRPQRIPQ
jgi:D-Tyr-tRNAtyr deacylase